MQKDTLAVANFKAYADALSAGDFEACASLRRVHAFDKELLTKFRALDRLRADQYTLFEREIQITRRERDGYKDLADSYKKRAKSPRVLTSDNELMRRGKGRLKQARAARLDHTDAVLPIGFDAC